MLARLGLRLPPESSAAPRIALAVASAIHDGLLGAAGGIALAMVFAARVALVAPLSYIVLGVVVLVAVVSTHGPGMPAVFSRPIGTLSIADLVPHASDLAALLYPALILAAVIVGLHALASHPMRHRALGDTGAVLPGDAPPPGVVPRSATDR